MNSPNYGDVFMDDDSDAESYDSDSVDDDSADAFSDEDGDDEDLPGPAIQIEQTKSLRAQLDKPLVEKVRHVCYIMDALGINLTIFLDALSWGDAECISDSKICFERTGLMKSKELPGILHRWWKPTRNPGSHQQRATGATRVMEKFASECFTEIARRELVSMTPLFSSPFGDDVKEEELTSVAFQDVINSARSQGSHLWSVLHCLSFTRSQMASHSPKNPDKIILVIMSMIQYTRSQKCSQLQKLFAIYFKFHGITAKGFDTLHALAITMSHKWVCNAVGQISEASMNEVILLMNKYPWLLSYDNLQIPFRMFSQRLDNQGDFGSGTAATVYIKRDAIPLPNTAIWDLIESRKIGMRNPLGALDIIDLSHKSFPHIHTQMKYRVLWFLLNCPDFDLPSYMGFDSPLLEPPLPIDQLPAGPEHITLQYLLGTVNIPEASYEDNSRLIKEWLRQLRLDTPEMQKKLGTEKPIAWVGDQLTVDRLRNLYKFRADDYNSFDRLDWMLLPFGWLHLMMAYGSTLHAQYLGTSKGRGLSQAFDLTNKKGLGTTSVKGTFHHDLTECLYHVAKAHIREDWLNISGMESLRDLRNFTPQELVDLASKIVDDHASSSAMDILDSLTQNQHDEIKYQTIMFNRDVLQFIVLDQAIKDGDVGLMEDFLPHLLFRFLGGNNSNYATEVLELLQALQ